jgi:hypothetical protein
MPAGGGRKGGAYDLGGRGYVKVYDFMAKELGLKGTELMLYARIFGFHQVGKTFYESRAGTAEFFGCTPRAIASAASSLVAKRLIEEVEPIPEARSLRTRCYRPCACPLVRAGIAPNTPEESSGTAQRTPEETSPLPNRAPEETSAPTGKTPEETSGPPPKQVHPIPKGNRR